MATHDDMTTTPDRSLQHQHNDATEAADAQVLLAELETAREMNRKLQDQLKKTVKAVENAERASNEALRAHTKMVETLTETMRENTALALERDMWKSRARRAMAQAESSQQQHRIPAYDMPASLGLMHITEEEARVIRKAIARLHHPDSGGDAERMKLWNASLDRIERHS
jgi:regulator of replication initiation timing